MLRSYQLASKMDRGSCWLQGDEVNREITRFREKKGLLRRNGAASNDCLPYEKGEKSCWLLMSFLSVFYPIAINSVKVNRFLSPWKPMWKGFDYG